MLFQTGPMSRPRLGRHYPTRAVTLEAGVCVRAVVGCCRARILTFEVKCDFEIMELSLLGGQRSGAAELRCDATNLAVTFPIMLRIERQGE